MSKFVVRKGTIRDSVIGDVSMINLTGGCSTNSKTLNPKTMACVKATKAVLAKLVESKVIPPESVR